MRILLLSDLHGNFPALAAIAARFPPTTFDLICNCGDSTVYAPFANEVLDWLQEHRVRTIRGNTDRKVVRLLQGRSFKKPRKPDKRIMYEHTARILAPANRDYLCSLKKKSIFTAGRHRIGLFHGSPADPDEFLFPDTPEARLAELATQAACTIIVTGHSHMPYHRQVRGVHFINPGSAGRMFDGDPRASHAILTLTDSGLQVHHYRTPYDIDQLVSRLQREGLPSIYQTMYRQGRKLN